MAEDGRSTPDRPWTSSKRLSSACYNAYDTEGITIHLIASACPRDGAAPPPLHKGDPMGQLPASTVTFLFTDVEGSTRLLQHLGDNHARVLGEHQALLRAAWAAHGGAEIDTAGDGFFVAFASAPEAVAAVAAATASDVSLTTLPLHLFKQPDSPSPSKGFLVSSCDALSSGQRA
jgi:hypothetical protein